MFSRLPKKYRAKYAVPYTWDEELLRLAVKVVGSAALVVLAGAGLDIYHYLH